MKAEKNILAETKNIYLVGIKGVGMTALAQILQSRGKNISGSDTQEKFFTDGVLRKLKIPFKEGFKAANLPANTGMVVYSTAFDPKTHPEIIAAKKKNIPVISYPQAVSELFNISLGIAISGTHGKTTTSALVADSMRNLKLSPTALIGSRVTNWGTNALSEDGNFFVIEADEHQNKLKFYQPWSIILTNIDYDHPDFYKKESDYYAAFKNWVGKWASARGGSASGGKGKFAMPKIGIFNGDDSKIQRLIRELGLKNSDDLVMLTYGKEKNSNFRIMNYDLRITNKIQIKINTPSIKNITANIKTTLIGEHNAYNLAAAFAFSTVLMIVIRDLSDNGSKLPPKTIDLLNFAAKSFNDFQGTERRMQLKGKKGKVLVFDDYGHHPQEVKATLTSVKAAYPKHQLFVIFQPHTFTRTKTFLKEFAWSLKPADQIGILPIYGSAREHQGNVCSNDIAEAINHKSCINFPTHEDCLTYLRKYKFKKPTILITMGAGDGWVVGEKFLKSKK